MHLEDLQRLQEQQATQQQEIVAHTRDQIVKRIEHKLRHLTLKLANGQDNKQLERVAKQLEQI